MTQPLLERLARHAKRTPDGVAVRDLARGDDVTWRDLADRTAATAAALSRDVAPGDVVLLACPNGAGFVAAFLAILAAGGRAFPLSHDSTEAELTAAAARSGAVGVIGTDAVLGALDLRLKLPVPDRSVAGGLARRSAPPDAPGASAAGTPAVRLVTRDPGRAGLLLQSSGTTGLPKIVFRTAASLDAVAAAMAESIGFSPADRVLMCLPLCHSYGVEHGLLAPVFAGSGVHLADGFDLNVVRAQLADAGVTIFPGVPFMYEALARLDGGNTLPALRRAYSAGGPLPAAVYEAFRGRYGVRVSQLYGATEIGSVTYGDPLSEGFDPAGVGRPMRGVSVRVLDPARPDLDKPLPPGAEGHIAVAARSAA